ncbi:hypothetical protein M0E87_12265 [Corynebacterium sp. CCM 9185]|uniref:Transposase n=1 Tax=Corynebacterium marambiense TaxID=2765364 RepID=A0ABS0VX90_9CORY|nr:hypothetical protein [Corynebacterium marambiense]MBI9001359.1 hypothetical protein [Corynebacterium marambiense]MCK7664417.1 hypothetical protein [Corynebacterium marambiense]
MDCASKTTTVRYEDEYPGSLVHTDMKNAERISRRGGWKHHGRGISYGFIHLLVDGHPRYSYETFTDETRSTADKLLDRTLDAT